MRTTRTSGKLMGVAMNLQTALLNLRQMGEADRLTAAAGMQTVELMANAGIAVARDRATQGRMSRHRAVWTR